MEAVAFRDAQAQFESAQAVVLGISADPQAIQARFASEYGLPYRLLCDTQHETAEAYGAWVEKTNYGKKYMGIQRSTFLIDPGGAVARIFPKVTELEHHPEEVLRAVREITPPA